MYGGDIGHLRGAEGGDSLKGSEGERCRLCPIGDRCLLDCRDSGWRMELRLWGDATLPLFLGGEGDLDRRGDLDPLRQLGDRLGEVMDLGRLWGDLMGKRMGDLARMGGGERSLLSR